MEVPEYETKITHIKEWLGTGSINIFGLPFAGKDTHCRELAQLFNGIVIGGGDILRSDATPKHIQDHIAQGLLAPTEEFRQIMLPYFAKNEFRGKPLILSAVGRWYGEEKGVLEASVKSGHPLLAVIHLKIKDEEVLRRWKNHDELQDRGTRDDDTEHILQTRMNEFRTKTLPVIDFYKEQGILIEVDGMPPRESVLKTILDSLYERALN